MSLDNYVAFYVAARHEKLQSVTDEYLSAHGLRSNTTIAYEVALDTHAHSEGEHTHFLCKWSDKTYRHFIQYLKTKDITMQGRATSDHPRTYGKVKHIRDFKRMLAYTIKGGQFISTEPLDLVSECQLLAFEKEDSLATLRKQIIEYIDSKTVWKREKIKSSFHDELKREIGYTYPEPISPLVLPTPLGLVKLTILEFFRLNPDHKMPCKSRVMYFAQYYMMYRKDDGQFTFPIEQILDIFF